jgi:uncharacterized protein
MKINLSRSMLLAILALLALPVIALGDGTEDENNFRICEAEAKKGGRIAQYNLGYKYANGEGVEKNILLAVDWYLKAAEQDLPEAQFNLAAIYWHGLIGNVDRSRAMHWIRKAAEQGMPRAQYSLGNAYYWGSVEGVGQDFSKAAHWFTKAAEQGDSYSQFNLGICFKKGYGVKQDLNTAFTWFELSAKQGIIHAETEIGLCYFEGFGVKKDTSKAISYWLRSATSGHDLAQYNLGICYMNGQGIEQNYQQAYALLTLAAETDEIAREALSQLSLKLNDAQLSSGKKRAEDIRKIIEKKLAENPDLVAQRAKWAGQKEAESKFIINKGRK